MTLDDPLQSLNGIGPRRAADLERVGLRTVGDLLSRFPLRYEDRSTFRDMATVSEGEVATICGTVVSCGLRLTRRPGFKIFHAVVRDGSGTLRVSWLNQPYMTDVIHRGAVIVLFGEITRRDPGGLQLTNPQYELVDEEDADTIHTGRIVPVYEKAGSVTGRIQRRIVHDALRQLPAELPDLMPPWLFNSVALADWRTALIESHFPAPGTDLVALNAFRSPAQLRLIFDEFLHFQLGLLLRRQAADAERKPAAVVVNDRIRDAVRARLPFALTDGQRSALKEIVTDMTRPQAMHRMLQGDVGTGKTIVALLAAVVAIENGLQVAMMAPTEILAEQHYLTVRRLLETSPYRVALLTGSTPTADRRRVQGEIESGMAQLVVGTHALVQQKVTFSRLGLVVIDEQHRFGVMQRAILREKGWRPDVLVMTATPIPRTLALTTYGDLDVSVIRELPPGRTPIKTTATPQSRRDEIYACVRSELEQGRQAYIVYPLIEESSKVDLRAATEAADTLAAEVFPAYRVALLHGRLKPEEKDHIMREFAAGRVHVLVSTTVIEVGIDVPNASVMVVEHAERFGLAQLHQLRGRVGRGGHQSFCVLLYQAPLGVQGRERLKTLVETADGFVIAERDLALRGPGDFFGTRQSGAPTLRSGDLLRDHEVMERARTLAGVALSRRGEGEALLDEVRRTWSARFGLASVG
ncbi:MAG: ATP-dependent DNA helicase RecG [Acidobacteria bacterium]|nr:ATP-dependent DNA helicase RecG [Acidobacteriota bacterium]